MTSLKSKMGAKKNSGRARDAYFVYHWLSKMSRKAQHVYSRKYTEPWGAREERSVERRRRMTGLDLYLDSDQGEARGRRGGRLWEDRGKDQDQGWGEAQGKLKRWWRRDDGRLMWLFYILTRFGHSLLVKLLVKIG